MKKIYVFAAKSETYQKASEMEIGIEYKPDSNVVAGWTFKSRYVEKEYEDPMEFSIEKLADVPEMTEPLKFSSIEVENETKIHISDFPNVHCEYVDGLIMKTIDAKAEQEIEKLKPDDKKKTEPPTVDQANLIFRGGQTKPRVVQKSEG